MAGPVNVLQSNPKLLTRLRSKQRVGHYRLRTELAYVTETGDSSDTNRLTHPEQVAESDVVAFLDISPRISMWRSPSGFGDLSGIDCEG